MSAMLPSCLTQRGLARRPINRIADRHRVYAVAGCKKPLSTLRHTTSRIPRTLQRAGVSGSPLVQKLTASELEVAIQDRSLPIVIDFYATWCGPCLLMAQELLKVAELLQGKVRILKVDTDEEQELSSQLKIEGLPTLMFFSTDTSKKALRLEGMIPAETVIKIINEEL